MPVYNGIAYLSQAIESILCQVYKEWELVIVDDGSYDDSLIIAQEYANCDTRIRVVHQENRGLAGAINRGIEESDGELLCGLAQDDLKLPEALSTAVKVLVDNQDIDAVYYFAQFIDSQGNRLHQAFNRIVPPDQLYDELIGGNFIGASTVLFRRSVLEKVGLFDETLFIEDWDFLLRLSRDHKVVGIPETLELYRRHGENISKNFEKMEAAKFSIIHKHFGPAVGDPNTWPRDRRRGYSGVNIHCAIEYINQGDIEKATSYLRQGILIWPYHLEQVDLYYQIAFADQPIGVRGDLSQLNTREAEAHLFWILDTLYTDTNPIWVIEFSRSRTNSYAYLTLAILSYGKRDMKEARRYLWLAAANSPRIAFDRRFLETTIKSLMGKRILALLGSRRIQEMMSHRAQNN